jgi:hypothetical protein
MVWGRMTMGTRKIDARRIEAKDEASMKIVGGPHDSVLDLVRAISSPEFTREFEERSAARRLVFALAVMRGAAGVTQAELAGRMGCAQPKVSKLESATDADLNLGDVVRYAAALGHSVSVTFTSEDGEPAKEVRVESTDASARARKRPAPAG